MKICDRNIILKNNFPFIEIQKNIIGTKHKDFSHLQGNRMLNYYISKDVPESMEWYMRKLFYKSNSYFPNFEEPQTFNEKVHWFKLYYHNPLITTCCDKFKVKDYAEQVLGKGYTVPTINSWTNVNDINFDELPEKFVLKVNWSSGFNIIVKNKALLDIDKVKHKINQWMQPYNNSYYQSYNWGYKDMKPVIYAEEYIEQMDGQVYDYKFFCYNGEPKNLFVATDRYTHKCFNFYDMDWNLLPFSWAPNTKYKIEKPKNFAKMVELSQKLSAPFPFVRCDFYEIGDQVLLGEMTFYPGGGLLKFKPSEYDYEMGSYIQLPDKWL